LAASLAPGYVDEQHIAIHGRDALRDLCTIDHGIEEGSDRTRRRGSESRSAAHARIQESPARPYAPAFPDRLLEIGRWAFLEITDPWDAESLIREKFLGTMVPG
jgi:hypothetical protein